VINWFESPAANLERAMGFYGKVLDGEVAVQEIDGIVMGFLPNSGDPEGVGGAVVAGEGYTPSAEGALVYLNGGPDLAKPLGRVEAAGGLLVLPK
ncbi:MAG: VOC family protein, partial [Bacteroidota bacterium]